LDLTRLSDYKGGPLSVISPGDNGSNLRELAIVVLDSMLIRFSNPYDEIIRICPRITSLDLSRNLVPELSIVAEICRPLKELRTLRLTGNRFSRVELDGELADAFGNVEWLAFNMCALRWDEVRTSDGLS
jgi:tubulin-specific chaperone E